MFYTEYSPLNGNTDILGRSRRDHMVFGFTTIAMQSLPIITKVVSWNLAHGEVFSIQHYVIVSHSDKHYVIVSHSDKHYVIKFVRGQSWSWSYGSWIHVQLPMQSVAITSKVVSSNPIQVYGDYSLQHYVIKFVSDFRQVGGFLLALRFLPPIKLTITI